MKWLDWCELLKETSTIEVKNFFEIGAHFFEDAIQTKEYFNLDPKNIYVFEPTPSSFEKGISNEKAKEFNSYNVACSNIEGEVDFIDLESKNFNDSGRNSLIISAFPNSKKIKVNSIRMDKFIKENNLEIDFLKLDVEGAEHLVLEGFGNLEKIKAIQVETNSNKSPFGENDSKIINFLLKNDFEIIKKEIVFDVQYDILAIHKKYLKFKTDLLSIIIPVFNTPLHLLKKCFDSIINQTFQNFEVILVCDYYSEEINCELIKITKQDYRFKLIQNKNREGTFKNRFTGFKNSIGEYLFFIDSDDFFDKDLSLSLLKELKEKSADLINPQGSYFFLNQNKTQKIDSVLDGVFLIKRNVLNKYFLELKNQDTFFINGEDKVFRNLLKDIKIISSSDFQNYYYYVITNPNQNSNSLTKSFFDLSLRVITELHFNVLKDDILDVSKYFFQNSIMNNKEKSLLVNFVNKNLTFDIKTIPKVIHYVWLGDKNLPENYIKTWKEKNPEYLILQWDDSFFKNNDFVQKWIKEKKYSFATDYIRCWILYNFGGIYLDTDVECLKSFDDKLLNQEQIFSYEDNDFIVQSAVMASCFKNKYIKQLLNWFEDENNSYNETEIEIKGMKFKSLMPNIITKVLENEKLNIYPNEYFCANHYTEQGKKKYKPTDNTYCIHHFDGSWLKAGFDLADFGFTS
jgi:FkbM family methyltransferase